MKEKEIINRIETIEKRQAELEKKMIFLGQTIKQVSGGALGYSMNLLKKIAKKTGLEDEDGDI